MHTIHWHILSPSCTYHNEFLYIIFGQSSVHVKFIVRVQAYCFNLKLNTIHRINTRRKRLTQLMGQSKDKTGPIFCQHQSIYHKCYESFRNRLAFVGAFLRDFTYYIFYDTLSLCSRHFPKNCPLK